jgi:hypothetical protein
LTRLHRQPAETEIAAIAVHDVILINILLTETRVANITQSAQSLNQPYLQPIPLLSLVNVDKNR